MKILVTGGAGFIGSHIQDALIAKGHDVAVLDNLVTGRKENLNSKATFFEVDLTDKVAVGKVFAIFKPEVVYHLAAQMDVRKSVADPQFDASVNIIGALNMMEAGRNNGLKKVIFSSTGGAIYGEQDEFPADENHPTRPLSPYGITKLAFEKYLYFYKQTYDINYTILRYANVYGPRQNPHGEAGVVAIFCHKLNGSMSEPLTVNGDGKQTRDYVFVENVVAANVAALDHGQCDIFNVGTGIETDVNQLAQVLIEVSGKNVEIIHNPPKLGEQKRSVITPAKLEQAFGIEIKKDLTDGLRKTWEYFSK